jgi:hypothetical protein
VETVWAGGWDGKNRESIDVEPENSKLTVIQGQFNPLVE